MQKIFLLVLIFGLVTTASCHGHQRGKKAEEKLTVIDAADSMKLDAIVPLNVDSTSYCYYVDLRLSKFRILVKTTCLYPELLPENADVDKYPIKSQKIYFLSDNDTLTSYEAASRYDTIRLKTKVVDTVKTNAIKFISIVQCENGFFYYLSGGENCGIPCPEYWEFIDRTGKTLWQQYLSERGSYSRTIDTLCSSLDIYRKNSIVKTQVFPIEFAGQKIPSSLIKAAK